MRTRTFGPTDIETTVIGLGGMPLSLKDRPPEDEGVKVIHAALDAGMRMIDTADVYCIDDSDIGHNERLIARALREWSGDANEVLVATKGGLIRPGGEWKTDGRPEHLREACEKSLRALGVEAIAVYQLHAPDSKVPFTDSVGELSRLREEGKVRHVGLSNVSVAQIETASEIVPIVSVQNRCNIFDVSAFEEGVVDCCAARGLAFLPWSPVGGSGNKGSTGDDETLSQIGKKHDASAFEVALAWLMAKSEAVLPIPGASREKSARSSASAADLSLPDEDVRTIDRAVGL